MDDETDTTGAKLTRASAARARSLSRAIAALPAADRSLLELLFRHGVALDEVAAMVGEAPGAVRRRQVALLEGIAGQEPLDDVAERLRGLAKEDWQAEAPAADGEGDPVVVQTLHRVVRRVSEEAPELRDGAGGVAWEMERALLDGPGQALIEGIRVAVNKPSLEGVDVLDLGCGFGVLSVLLASRGARVTAVDPNPRSYRLIGGRVSRKHELPLVFRPGRADRLKKLEGASFDVIVASNVLCYVLDDEDRERSLRELKRVVRPGGWLVVRDPNRLHPSTPFGRSPEPVRLRGSVALRRELRRTGWARAHLELGLAHDAPRGLRRFARYRHVVARRPPQRREP